MSVIQSIREKYAKWAVVAIALALLGFILTDYFQAQSRMVGGETTIGVINGKKIDYRDFQMRLEGAEAQERARAEQMGQDYDEAQRHNTNESLWNRDVEKIIMNSEFEKAGIEVGAKEFTDYFYKNPPPDLRQNFTDQMGNLDLTGLQNWINQTKRSSNVADRDRLNMYLADYEYELKKQKYDAVLQNAIYYPKWYVEKQNADAALMGKISYIRHPYTNISDSAVTVTDQEIEDYVNKHKELYRQEESRSIAYVLFDAAATAEDSAQIRAQLTRLKEDFAKDTLPARFLSGRGSATPYLDQYSNKTELQSIISDSSIITIPKDSVYGPYLEQHSYVLAKKVDERRLADSVYCRHILIRTQGAGAIPDSIASKRLDSVINVIKGGANFVTVMKQVSMDSVANTQDSLGIMRFSIKDITDAQRFDQDFAKYILFDGKKGQREKVKTQFGYHYIEIVDQKNIQPYYKFAFFSKNILASKETERRASEEASKFSNEARDLKSFEAAIAKSNGKYKKLEATNIGPNDISIKNIDAMYAPAIGGFGKIISCRSLIKEIYKADKGDVLKQEKIGDPRVGNKQVIAVVTDVLKEGTQAVHVARAGTPQTPSVERILKDKKKAEQIKKAIGTVTTLEAAAAALKDSIITADSVRITGARGLVDPKVLGAIFNSTNKGKVVPEPIAGSDAVYIIRVDDLTTTPVVADIEMQKQNLRNNAKQRQQFYNNPILVLKKTARIRDNRKNIY
ncbi:MAG TPA: peptidylprolyl isomerase [Chitinophagaceae bacterium]|nr:peptidylprolyl isomerase [Chitinophagaceae bacterium]